MCSRARKRPRSQEVPETASQDAAALGWIGADKPALVHSGSLEGAEGSEGGWRPKLVVEVRFDHVTGDRFRHGTKLNALAS
jgi:hypothetical protein